MQKLNIAVLGAGAMGRTHCYAINNIKMFYRDLPYEAVLHTVCTRNAEKAQKAMNEFGALNYSTDEDEVINNPEIDIIDICTPNKVHFASIMKALAADKSILCEKPLVVFKEEREELERALTGKTKTYGVVFNNRNYPSTLRARQLLSENRLGRIISFRSAYLHSSATNPEKCAGWKQNKNDGGGVLMDLGSHAIDLLLYILGGEYSVQEVFGKSQIAFPERLGSNGEKWETNAEEAFYMTAVLNNGAVGTIEASKITHGANDEFFVEIYGTDGALKWNLMEPNYLYFYDAKKIQSPLGGEAGFTRIDCCGKYDEPSGFFPGAKAPIGWLRGHLHGMYRYIDAVYNKIPMSPSFADGLLINKIMEKAYLSDKSGKFEQL